MSERCAFRAYASRMLAWPPTPVTQAVDKFDGRKVLLQHLLIRGSDIHETALDSLATLAAASIISSSVGRGILREIAVPATVATDVG